MTATDPITIDAIHIVMTVSGSCAASGSALTIDGNLESGVWTAATKTLTYANAEGLTIVGLGAITINADFRTDGTFNLTT